MNSKAERERTKQIQDKCQHLLNEMLKDDDNKYCVDCDAKGPRWASWNIGIFLCIRCAGLHRKLGVHISKVKSVNLDMWTPQQVVILQQMGNSRARAVYEANLPDNFRRPQNEVSLESFIRAKYEHKKYIAREWVAPPPPKVNWTKELEEEVEKVKKKKREAVQPNIALIRPVSTPPPAIAQPLPKPLSSGAKPSPTSSHSADLLGLDTPVKEAANKTASSDSDLFTSFLSASPETTPNTTSTPVANGSNSNAAFRTQEEDSFFNQSLSATPNKQKPLTKDSILALYRNSGNYHNPQLNANVLGPAFNPVLPAKPEFHLPGRICPSSTLQQNELLNSGIQFSNISATTASNLAFASNPFYSMAASGGQSDFSFQTTFANFPVTNSSNSAELQQAQFVQQMEAMNINKNNQFAVPPASHFNGNTDSKNQQVNFGESVTAANDFWQ